MMQLDFVDPATLKPYDRNPRHNDEAVDAVANSIRAFGFNCPIIVGPDNRICAGHTRWKAARKLGLREVPVVRVDSLTGDKFRAFNNIADNKTAELAEWDLPNLRELLKELESEQFDIGNLGFSEEELRKLLDADSEVDDVHENTDDVRTRPGDLYSLGDHRLLCGDSREPDALRRLLSDSVVEHVFAGTPCFNQKDYAQWADYASFNADMSSVIENCVSTLRPGGILVWHVDNDSTHHHDVVSQQSVLLEASGLVYFDTIIWQKTAANYAIPRNSHIRRNRCYYPAFQWEALLVFQRPGGPMPRMTREAAEYMSLHHTNVWEIAAVTNLHDRHGHPGPCPVELPYRSLLAYSRPDDLVLDPFAGSGTSLIACEKAHRRARVMERIPRYCDIIVKRWEQLSGKRAELISAAERPAEHQ